MHVEINREPKLSRIDNLFVLITQSDKHKLSLGGDLQKLVSRAIEEAEFEGRPDESVTLIGKDPKRITLIGIGPLDKITLRSLRAALLSVAKLARKNRQKSIAVTFPYSIAGLTPRQLTRSLADLLGNSDYKYDAYLSPKPDEKPIAIDCTLIPTPDLDAKAVRRISEEAATITEAVRTVRDLGNGPGNLITPTKIAERASEVAKETGIKCTIYDRKQIEKMKMGGLLAVNRGSGEEPRFILLEYSPKNAKKTICLVGKGITFDSGGISLKPGERMEEMKFDMCGAAAVIGSMQAVANLALPYKLIGLIPSTDNMPSGTAYKPGDIITMMSGKTVEIVNTDAEGRMILGDALHYAGTFKPDHLIDFATLTGACVIALGGEASGLFSNDTELARKLIESGERVGERLWRLPEWDEYKEHIRSEWADMKNSGGRWAGATTAALFLKEFVDCPSWAHIDIAGTAWAEHETSRDPKGATGVGVRLIVDFLESL
ncbi:MAG TPA: leucyl aminopeptidase [Thermoanaerobaculia bacterium]|nr:leucyl aminopeptidase [Thermoanaerobaculia bacterium]